MKKTGIAVACALLLAFTGSLHAQQKSQNTDRKADKQQAQQKSGAADQQNQSGISLEEGLLNKSLRTQNGEDVGEIEDVIFNRWGRVSHVLVDVGGFLGIGEKTVALNLNQLKFDNPNYAVYKGSRNDLENMQEVDRFAFTPAYRGYYGYPYSPYEPYGYGYDRPAWGARPYYGYRGPAVGARQNDQGGGDQAHAYFGKSQQNNNQQGKNQQGLSGRPISGERLVGAQVIDRNNSDLGDVEDVLINPSNGRITHAVVDTGGFWDTDSSKVLVPANQLRLVSPYVAVFQGTEQQLNQMPPYKGEE